MEAIRCKSSSQVSSQVMIPFGLLIVLAVGVSTELSLREYRSNYPVNMGKHEHCVKMIVACSNLQDKVETFPKSDEFGGEMDMEQETVDYNLDKYYRLGCVPVGLSKYGLRSFWNLVAKWEKQVHDLFLHQDFFAVVQEDDGGRKIKVTFGQLIGWCPDSDGPEDTTTTVSTMTTSAEESEESTLNANLVTTTRESGSIVGTTTVSTMTTSVEESEAGESTLNPNLVTTTKESGPKVGTTTVSTMTTSAEESEAGESTLNPNLVTTTKESGPKVGSGEAKNIPDSCNVSSTVDQWVRNEINGTLNMSSLTDRFPEFEKLLHSTGYSCCPYKSVRGRVEIINDAIDILEDLQVLKPSEKRNYTDIESDVRNLNKRLEHLKTGNADYSSGKCCPAFLNQLNSFQNGFQSSLKDFSPRKSNITLKGLLQNATTLEDQCSEQQNQLKNYIQNLDNNMNKTDSTCCVEEEKKIKLIENSLKDYQGVKSQPDLSEKINAVRENLAKTNKTLSDTENLLGVEAKQIEKLKAECGTVSQIQRSRFIDNLRSNVSKLVDDMEFIRTVNPSRSTVKKMYSDGNHNFQKAVRTFVGIELKSRTSQDQTEKCVQDIKTVKNTLNRVNLENSKNHVYHELFQMAAGETFRTYRKRQDDLEESVNKIVNSSTGLPMNSNISTPDINKLEKHLVNLTDVALPKLSQAITKRKKDENEKKNEHLKNIKMFNEEIKKKKAQILERLDKLNQNETENLVDENSEKMRQFEELISQLSDRQARLAKRIADRHEVLQQQVDEMNKRIAAASAAAMSCTLDCDLGELPTVDALAARVKVLEQKVKDYIKK